MARRGMVRTRLADGAARLAAGGYIIHAGWSKSKPNPQRDEMLHASATTAFEVLEDVPPHGFVKALSITEMTLGAALLLPAVPTVVAGAALTGFAGGLVVMYHRNPALHEPHSIFPTQAGAAIFKDHWLLALGLGLLLRRPAPKKRARAHRAVAKPAARTR